MGDGRPAHPLATGRLQLPWDLSHLPTPWLLPPPPPRHRCPGTLTTPSTPGANPASLRPWLCLSGAGKALGLCRGSVAEPGGRRGRCPGAPTRSGAGCCRRPRRRRWPDQGQDVAEGRGARTGRQGCDTHRLFQLSVACPQVPHGTVSSIPEAVLCSRTKAEAVAGPTPKSFCLSTGSRTGSSQRVTRSLESVISQASGPPPV